MVGPEGIRRVVGLVTAAGDAITFSRTRDGGAACICILSEGEQIKLYGSTPEELDAILDAIAGDAQQEVMRAVS